MPQAASRFSFADAIGEVQHRERTTATDHALRTMRCVRRFNSTGKMCYRAIPRDRVRAAIARGTIARYCSKKCGLAERKRKYRMLNR